ncbi:MAG TPA: thiamine pyrophosphate-binding protein [Thermoleophilaceae bacterium]|nr:thiamine pyrophosphate-binding protein [Thermoleophilaceae bacterium]
MPTGGQALVRTLEEMGVRICFGLPGVHNLPAWEALRGSSVRLVGVRHEQTAVYAADGDARVTGELGVALTTTGPGAANALGATGEAWASGSPVLVIATDIPTTLRRPGVYRGVLHETRDQGAMFAPVVKEVVRVGSADEIGEAVARAAATARAAPAGPVYLEIPTDLLRAPATIGDSYVPQDVQVARSPDEAAELCAAADRPLLWVGGGAKDAGEGIAALATALGAPVIETYSARGVLDPSHPSWLGLPPHLPEVGALWDDADLVVTVGSDLDGMMTQNFAQPQPPRMVALNVDAADAGKNYAVDVVVEGDAAETAPALAEALPGGAEPPSLAALRSAALQRLRETEPAGVAFLDAMEDALDEDTVVFADMCIPGYWLASMHPFARPRRLAYPVGWGTLGFAFPASIGAALAQDDPVLCVCGDGGFMFAAGELAAVAQERAPLTILVVDDGGYGMLRYDQHKAGTEPYGVDLATPDWNQLAGAFGIECEEAEVGAGLADVVRRRLASKGPSLVVARTELPPPPSTSPRWYRRA